MKKILFITSNDHVPWGGSEELWFGCAIEALKKGMQVAICTQWDPLPGRFGMLKDYPAFTLLKKNIAPSLPLRVFNRFVPKKFNIVSAVLTKEVALWKPDIAVISQGNNIDGLDAMQFCKKHSITYFTIVQAVYEGQWPGTAKAAEMRTAYSGAIANYFVSQANLNLTTLQMGGVVKNGTVVRNPFNIPYNNNFTFPDTATYKLACVARYEFYAKGQDVLLEVMSQQKWRDRNVEVTLYGSGPNQDGMQRLIAYFNLQNVRIGGQQLTTEIWQNNHALVLPSRYEGLPLALVEAMLAGRFGIVTNVSGNKEVFTDGITGFLAEAPQAEYFDKAMERAWERRYEWEQIGQHARKQIQSLVPQNPAMELFTKIDMAYKNAYL